MFFKMKEILGFNVPANFLSIWTCFGNIIRKTKTNLPRLHLWTYFFLLWLWNPNIIINFYRIDKTFLRRICEISLMVSTTAVLKKDLDMTPDCTSSNHVMQLSAVLTQSQKCRKGTFNFTEIKPTGLKLRMQLWVWYYVV